MAKEKEPKKSDAADGKAAKPKVESSNKLFVMMFAGVMVIQLVIIIVAVIFIFGKNSGSGDTKHKKEDTEKVSEKEGEGTGEEKKKEDDKMEGKVLPPFTTKDLFINPKGTGGKRFLLTQVGIYIKAETEKEKEEIEKTWEAQFNSIINQYLSGKTVEELDDLKYRDSMAIEIKTKINESVPGKKIQKIVFSKFALQ